MWLLEELITLQLKYKLFFTQYKINLGYVSMKSYLKQYLWGLLYEIS